MEEIIIHKYQLKNVQEALRLAANATGARELKSCMDRDIMHAVAIVDAVMEGKYKELVKRPM